MKAILLFSKYLSDPTGASAVMRFLKQGKDIFKENDVDIEFFTRDDIIPQKNSLTPKKSSEHSIKDRIMSLLRKQSKSNAMAAILHKYIRSVRASKVLIEKYMSLDHDVDVVFMHELDTCYEYLKSRKKKI